MILGNFESSENCYVPPDARLWFLGKLRDLTERGIFAEIIRRVDDLRMLRSSEFLNQSNLGRANKKKTPELYHIIK